MSPTRLPIAGVLVLVIAAPLAARPPHKQALADHYGPFLAAKLNDCRTCHLPDPSGAKPDESEKPHNPFGARVAAVKDELRGAGKKLDIATRLDTIADEDSDEDGVPNLFEVLAGHAPGDRADKPTDEEVAKARQTLVAFRKYQSRYPWRPFETVKRPPVPDVKDGRNQIDAFLAAERAEQGLAPRPEADKPTLLRRVTLDLTGLPPTADELHAFLKDESPNAYEKVVDRLLASPRFGERWGRHWMDVWRYSDWAGWTDGGQIRDSHPHVWRWRDWIVESLNADKGYDRMVVEMLAADEVAPDDPAALRATGYLVRNYKMLSREKWMQDTVDHTFLAFQGVTLGCAKCHDHMYDPISQKEYYQVRAVFTPHKVRIDRVPGQADTKKDGVSRVYDADLNEPTYLLVRGDDRSPDKSAGLTPGVPAALGGTFPEITPVKLPSSAVAPDKRPFAVEEDLAAAVKVTEQAKQAVTALRPKLLPAILPAPAASPLAALPRLAAVKKASDDWRLAELDADLATVKRDALEAAVKAERLEDAGKKESPEWKQSATAAAKAQLHQAVLQARRNLLAAPAAKRAESEKALAKAEKDAVAPETTAYTKRPAATYPATSSGRRLALAKWLASPENPLTARVAVNHVWLRHFGQALAPSVFDFGRNGRPPSHPALLDWLAAELMESGWSMKKLHRLVVTSAAYRLGSTSDAGSLTKDPDNRYYWRMAPRRLEAEAVRDCLLSVSGKLDLTTGGPDVDHNQGLTVPRRSLYFRHAAEKQMEFLKLFDAAGVTECYQRKASVVPQQALALANSPLAIRSARLLARSLAGQHSDAGAFVTAAFEHVLSRPPTGDESAECVAFLAKQAEALAKATKAAGQPDADGNAPSPDPALRARENLVHVLVNHHEFVTIR